MERTRRRWWTWSVSILAALVVFAACVSGLFQLAVMSLPNYRDDLSVWVTKVAGRPVQIGGINLVWRGLAPRLDLSDITLYSEDGENEALTAERLSLGFGVWRMLTGEFAPSRVVLSGLDLDVHVDADGHVIVAGFEQDSPDQHLDPEVWLRNLERFDSVLIERCTVDLVDERLGPQQLRFQVDAFEVDIGRSGLDVEGRIKLPIAYGDTLDFEAEIEGPLPKPAQWQGEFSASAAALLPQPWLRGRVLPGTRVAATDVDARISGRFAQGALTQLGAQISSGVLLMTRGADAVEAKSFSARMQAQREEGGWRIDLDRIKVDGDEQLRAQLHYFPDADGAYRLNADAPLLRLDHLAPWLRFARKLPDALQRVPDLSGELDGLVLRLQRAPQTESAPASIQYSVRAELDQLALASHDGKPGFDKLNGELSANESGGRFRLGEQAPTLRLPQIISEPLDFDQLSGQLVWKRLAEAWQLNLPTFDWKIAGTTGRGQLDLLLPEAAERSPELKLGAHFSAADLRVLKPYMPLHWGEHLRQWLDRAVVAGRVTRAQLAIDGPLHDFPFEQGQGDWNLDFDVTGVKLDYAPEWPAAENLQARLRFRGNGLVADVGAAQIAGVPVERVQARLDNFRDHRLNIDGSLAGDIGTFYGVLRRSPLRETLATLVNKTRASGDARVKLQLGIPLDDSVHTQVDGSVALDGVQLQYDGLHAPFEDLRGELAFNNIGVSAQRITARFEDAALTAQVQPREHTHGVILADFTYAPNAEGQGLSAYIPALLRPVLKGSSAWRAELPLGAATSELLLSSDLRGTAVALPVPAGKAADEMVPLRVAVGGEDASGMHIRVAYDTRLNADIALMPPAVPVIAGQAREWTLRGINLRLGSTPAAPAREGLYLSGDATDLDAMAWGAALSASLREGNSGGSGLRGIDLHAQRLLFGSHQLRDLRLVYLPSANGWTGRLTGSSAEGELTWTTTPAGAALKLDVTRLEVERQPAQPNAEAAAKGSSRTFDPNEWPVLDLSCRSCLIDGTDFGQVRAHTVRIPGGQQLEYFTAENGKLDAHVNGEWLRVKDQSSAKAKFVLSSPDFTSVLKSLDYAQNLAAKRSLIEGELSWLPAADGIAWEQARGHLALDFENGTLKAVDPGAGRVLGLLNFYALPRRLTLDFRDVVRSGMAFDKIKGSFDLGSGNATTDDLKIEATGLRMEMRGRVGLVARDYDQHVSVYPDVSSGITLGAALLGGPALAALAFIAQEVLDKPIEQATHLDYQVTGSWDNPEVKRVDAKDDKTDKPAKDVKDAKPEAPASKAVPAKPAAATNGPRAAPAAAR